MSNAIGSIHESNPSRRTCNLKSLRYFLTNYGKLGRFLLRHLLERIQKIKQHFLVRLEYQRVTLDPTTRPPIITAVSTPSTVFDATFSGLRPYTKYRVRLTAVNQAMKEGYSEWSEIRTLAAPPSEMGNLSVTPTFDGRSLFFSWSEPSLPNGQVKLKTMCL